MNAAHTIVVNLNALRKQDRKAAKLVAQQFLDNVLVQSGVPFDMRLGCERQFTLIDGYLNLMVEKNETGASRATKKEPEVTIEMDSGSQKSAMDQAKANMKGDDEPTITWEKTVNEDDVGRGRGRKGRK